MASRAELPSRREIALALPLLPALGWSGARQDPSRGDDAAEAVGSTAILIRHAEKDAGSDPKDPGLSEAGKERARALLALLARAGATHLFASEYRRTQETLRPLAEARSLRIEVVPAADPGKLADRVRALPAGSVAVVAGHSNTVPAIASALGGAPKDLVTTSSGPSWRDDEYGRILVVTLRSAGGKPDAKSAAATLELAYGA